MNVLLEDIFRNAESRTATDAHEIRSLRAQLQRSQREKHLLFARTRRFQEHADGQAATHEEEILRLRGENDGLRARVAQADELVGGLAEVKISVVALKEGMEAVAAAMRRE